MSSTGPHIVLLCPLSQYHALSVPRGMQERWIHLQQRKLDLLMMSDLYSGGY